MIRLLFTAAAIEFPLPPLPRGVPVSAAAILRMEAQQLDGPVVLQVRGAHEITSRTHPEFAKRVVAVLRDWPIPDDPRTALVLRYAAIVSAVLGVPLDGVPSHPTRTYE